MSSTQDEEEKNTSLEKQYRTSLQHHRIVIAVLSFLLLSSVALLAGVIFTDGLRSCEQKLSVSVHWQSDASGEIAASETEPFPFNDCNPGCQPILLMKRSTCDPGSHGCEQAHQRRQKRGERPPGGDVLCGTGVRVVCDESANGQNGQAEQNHTPYDFAAISGDSKLVCLTTNVRARFGATSRNFLNLPLGCAETNVTVCGQ